MLTVKAATTSLLTSLKTISWYHTLLHAVLHTTPLCITLDYQRYMIREMRGMREYITRGDRLDSIINMEPQDFLITRGQQETMTSPQLKEYISKQKQRGFANIKEFEVEYHRRIAMSFAAFILTSIGLSLSSRKVKGGMGLHLGIGLGLSFSYILFQTISSTFAINGNMMPAIAVWIPNILYLFIAIYLYRKSSKIKKKLYLLALTSSTLPLHLIEKMFAKADKNDPYVKAKKAIKKTTRNKGKNISIFYTIILDVF